MTKGEREKMSNSLIHVVINTLVYLVTTLALSILLTWVAWWWVVFFGVIFDLDHVPYFLYHTRPLTLQNLKASAKEDYAKKVPHFYACHTLEFEVLLACIYLGTGANIWAMWALAGWGIHVVTDAVSYLRQYHGLNPWAQYWSVGYYIAKEKRGYSR